MREWPLSRVEISAFLRRGVRAFGRASEWQRIAFEEHETSLIPVRLWCPVLRPRRRPCSPWWMMSDQEVEGQWGQALRPLTLQLPRQLIQG